MSGVPVALPAAMAGVTAAGHGGRVNKLHQAAQRFEAMFLGEMVRLSRPKPDPANPFTGGQGEQIWGSFMDQAMGDAMAANGGTGLAKQIEAALDRSAGNASGSQR